MKNSFFVNFVFPASKLLAQIISILREEKRLKKHYLELLITQQLSVLDLSREGDEVACHLRLASIRCSVRSKYFALHFLDGCRIQPVFILLAAPQNFEFVWLPENFQASLPGISSHF
jgi:hypothetical protein